MLYHARSCLSNTMPDHALPIPCQIMPFLYHARSRLTYTMPDHAFPIPCQIMPFLYHDISRLSYTMLDHAFPACCLMTEMSRVAMSWCLETALWSLQTLEHQNPTMAQPSLIWWNPSRVQCCKLISIGCTLRIHRLIMYHLMYLWWNTYLYLFGLLQLDGPRGDYGSGLRKESRHLEPWYEPLIYGLRFYCISMGSRLKCLFTFVGREWHRLRAATHLKHCPVSLAQAVLWLRCWLGSTHGQLSIISGLLWLWH
jgi:hypothetical protein